MPGKIKEIKPGKIKQRYVRLNNYPCYWHIYHV